MVHWHGIDRQDGKCRLYRRFPSYFPREIRRSYRRGRLVKSFTKYRLYRIAWSLGVSNPEGFCKADGEIFDMSNDESFQLFIRGWGRTGKEKLGNYIWNRLYDLNRITIV